MAAVPSALSQFGDLIDKSIQVIEKKVTNLVEEVAIKLYNQNTTEDYFEKDSSVSGFGDASRLTENAIIISDSPVQGFSRTYTQLFYGQMAQFTMYDWKFGITKRKLEDVVSDLKNSILRKRERLLTEYLENSMGATTSYTVSDQNGNYTKAVTGGDGVALINSSHTREDGGSAWANIITDGVTTNMSYSYSAMKAAFRTASLITDPRGNLMNVTLDKMICRKGSQVYFDAMEVNGALKKNFKPTSADHDGASFGAFDIIALPFQLSANAAFWWMNDSSLLGRMSGLQYFESQAPQIEPSYTDYKTKTVLVSSTAAFDYGHNDGRSWVGSNGANA